MVYLDVFGEMWDVKWGFVLFEIVLFILFRKIKMMDFFFFIEIINKVLINDKVE